MNEDPDSEAVGELFHDSFPPSLCMKGQQYARSGRLDVALMYFMRALNIDSEYALAWCDHGHCLYQLGRFEDAVHSLSKATALSPHELLPWALLGLTHIELEGVAEARHCLKICRTLGPDDSRTEALASKLEERFGQQKKSWQFWRRGS